MSQQNSQTPRALLDAIEAKFGVTFTLDLACNLDDCVVRVPRADQPYHDGGIDSLNLDWSEFEWQQGEAAWLNNPWKMTKQFAEKCAKGTDRYIEDDGPTSIDVSIYVPGIPIFSLWPAGVGSEWFGKHVLGKCAIYFLNPRVTFLDPRTGLPFVSLKTGKPQTGLNDAMLCHWGSDEPGVYWWNWKEKPKKTRAPRKVKAAPEYHQIAAEIAQEKLSDFGPALAQAELTEAAESGT